MHIFRWNKEKCFKNTRAFASGCLMGRRALSFESDNWFVGLHVVAAAKSLSICLDLISGDGLI